MEYDRISRYQPPFQNLNQVLDYSRRPTVRCLYYTIFLICPTEMVIKSAPYLHQKILIVYSI